MATTAGVAATAAAAAAVGAKTAARPGIMSTENMKEKQVTSNFFIN